MIPGLFLLLYQSHIVLLVYSIIIVVNMLQKENSHFCPIRASDRSIGYKKEGKKEITKGSASSSL